MGKRKSNKEESTPLSEDGISTEPIGTTIDLTSFSEPAKEEPVTLGEDEIKPFISIDNGSEPKAKRKYTKRSKPESTDFELPPIDGEMLLMFVDLIIPGIIAMANNFMTGERMSPDDVMMTEKQQAKMKKLADKAAERINLNMHPMLGLTIMMGTVYTTNFLAAKRK